MTASSPVRFDLVTEVPLAYPCPDHWHCVRSGHNTHEHDPMPDVSQPCPQCGLTAGLDALIDYALDLIDPSLGGVRMDPEEAKRRVDGLLVQLQARVLGNLAAVPYYQTIWDTPRRRRVAADGAR
jgi:hypothetical protein